jgi:uncharacterized heparinase superfamily protein
MPPVSPGPPSSGQAREGRYARWIELNGRSGASISVSPVHRLRISGPGPAVLSALPIDARPASRARGEAILQGRWRFGAAWVETPPGHAPWGPEFPSFHFADRIHRFGWLRDLAACGADGQAHACALSAAWIAQYGKWDDFAWRLSLSADRLIHILSAGPWLFEGLESADRDALLESLGRHIRHLLFMGPEETDPVSRFRIAVALCLAGAAAGDGARALEAGLGMLEAECAAQILPDGGHISRSPEQLAHALIDVQAVEDLMLRLGMSAPAFLTRLQPRMAAMLSFFQTRDGGLLPANGGGDASDGLARVALRPHGALSARFAFARLSAYQRIQAGDLTVYIDAGAAPPRPHGGRAHAGALALHVDDGPERIITSCAAGADIDPELREAARRTAAHSVLCLNDEDSAPFAADPLTGLSAPEGPVQLAVRRLEETDQFLLEGQHGGWRDRYGLIYRRRVFVAMDGSRLTGEESLFRPMSGAGEHAKGEGVPYAIRFHLHPDVEVRQGPDERTLFLGLPMRRRIWRFRSEALLFLEESRYWGNGAARRTRQLVIRADADPSADGSLPPNRVRWALSLVEPGVEDAEG